MRGIPDAFANPVLEAAYRQEFETEFTRNIRNIYKILLPVAAGYATIERLTGPAEAGTSAVFLFFLPVLATFLCLTYSKRFLSLVSGRAQLHFSYLAVLVLGVLEFLLSRHNPDYYTVGRNHPVLLYIIFLHSAARLELFWSTLVSVSLSVLVALFQYLSEPGINARLLTVMIVTNAMGMWISHQLQIRTRQDFLDRHAAEAAATKLDQMLTNVIPKDVANRLKDATADRLHFQQPVDDLAVLFSDLSGFTTFARQVTPEVLVNALNRINSLFDAEADRLGLTKIKTLGDAAVYVSGLTGRPDPAALKAMGSSMLVRLDEANRELGTSLKIRIGLGRGRATCGVIGKLRVKFDVWGEAIEAAERHQKAAEPGEIRFDARLDGVA